MAQTMFVLSDGRVVVPSFVDGGRIKQIQRRRPMSQDDILARALWLQRHGKPEEAERFLEDAIEQMH